MAERELRQFTNPWLKDKNCRSGGSKKTGPHEVLEGLKPRLLSEIEEGIAKVDQEYMKHRKDQSIYTGSAGPALLHLHLANTIYYDNYENRQRHLHQSLMLLTPSIEHLDQHRNTFLCGGSGPLSIAVVVYFLLDMKEEGLKCLQTLKTLYTKIGPALLHLHLANTIYYDNYENRQRHLHQSLMLLTPSIEHLDQHRNTFLCGGSGPLSIAVVVYFLLDMKEEGLKCLQTLKTLYTKNKADFKALSSELLYGYAGYLYALLFVNSYVPGAIEQDLIEEVCSLVVSTGQSGCEDDLSTRLMYTWHGKHYLGAAHGIAGIMTVLLQVMNIDIISRSSGLIQHTVDYLLSLQQHSKNFPSSLESIHRDTLVQWCHGAPGFVHLWANAYKVFGRQEYLTAAQACGEVTWERGLLRKGYGLCHGVAGNGYVFLQLYRLTGEDYHLHRAIKFVEWCLTSSERECPTPDRPFSLFEGTTGKLYFLADVCNDVNKTCFPGLELPVVSQKITLPKCS